MLMLWHKMILMLIWLPLLTALQTVETGSYADPAQAVGDGGRAIGPLQIHRACWADAQLPDGNYEDCVDAVYANRVAIAYLSRYAKVGDFADMARTWNGGPQGRHKPATLAYWNKVRECLSRMEKS